MVALNRDDAFDGSVSRFAKMARRRGVGSPPFNWRLVSALVANAAVWGGLLAGARALIR